MQQRDGCFHPTCPFEALHEEAPRLYAIWSWCQRSIASREDKEYGTGPNGERRELGSRTVYYPLLEWLEFNLRADRVKPKDWGEARDWVLSIARWTTDAPLDHAQREAEIRTNRARYENHWRQVEARRKAEVDGGG